MKKTPKQKIDISGLNLHDPDVRRYIVEKFGLQGFCLVYLPHHFFQKPAQFHKKLVKVFEDPKEEMVEVIGFRGSAKSTYGSLAVPLYLGLEDKYQFILPVGDTSTQVKLNLENIKYELENNELILKDYGIAYNPERNWSSTSLLLNNGCLIMGRSRGQKMRGLKHRQYRPQVVIVDDPEDLEWVKEKKNRDKTERWFNAEVIPAQAEDKSKLILIGNWLHKNALMARVKKKRKSDGTRLFKLIEFPLIKKKGGGSEWSRCTWKGKYPTPAALQKQKDKVTPTAWAREYLLKIISEKDQVIADTDIHYYPNVLPDKRDENGAKKYRPIDGGVGVDLAISEKETADFTTMVGGIKIKLDDKNKILILPNPVNKRMGYDATLKEAEKLNAFVPYGTKWYVEDKGYQRAALQGMKKKGLSIYPMTPISDKKARLEVISPFIKDGTVLFPEHGCDELIEQLVGFGSEEHDDLVDALVYLIMGMIKRRVFKAVERPDKI